jgi:hypothetical protein
MKARAMSEVAAPVDPVKLALERADRLEDAIPVVQTTPPPSAISEDDANALVLEIGMVTRGIESTMRAVEFWRDCQQKRVDKLMAWYGPALLALAKARIGEKKPRRLALPFGTLSLRKDPDRLVAIDTPDAERAFKVYDAREGHKWSRVQVSSEALTHDDLNRLVDALPEDLLTKLRWKNEAKKKELIELWKTTGEIAPGFEVVFGDDKLKLDVTTQGDAGE